MMPQEIASGSKPSIDIEELIAQPKKAVTALLKALKLYDPVRLVVQAATHPPAVPCCTPPPDRICHIPHCRRLTAPA
jgi:hypothetical protein